MVCVGVWVCVCVGMCGVCACVGVGVCVCVGMCGVCVCVGVGVGGARIIASKLLTV